MVLAEKNSSWEDKRLSFSLREHLAPEYLKIYPNGVVPALVHDGGVVLDSSVINEYLDHAFPAVPMRPSSMIELAHMRTWRQYIDEVPTPSIRHPSFNAYFVTMFPQGSDSDFEDYAAKLPLRKDFYLKMGRTGFAQAEVDAALARLRQTLQRMEAGLKKTQWLANDMFTLADVSIMPSIVRMEDLFLAHMWKDLPAMTDWYQHLQARPAFAITYYPGSRDLGPSC